MSGGRPELDVFKRCNRRNKEPGTRDYQASDTEIMTRMQKDSRNKNQASRPRLDGRQRGRISPGMMVKIELKKDQGTGKLTEGKVKEILTGTSFHPHGIKVRLEDGSVGRVQQIG